MFIVDRESFIYWTKGVLLHRVYSGECVVGDDVRHPEAVSRMDAGETIGLTVNGELRSTMRSINGAYTEEPYVADKKEKL